MAILHLLLPISKTRWAFVFRGSRGALISGIFGEMGFVEFSKYGLLWQDGVCEGSVLVI
jgi:hypothetical protein